MEEKIVYLFAITTTTAIVLQLRVKLPIHYHRPFSLCL